MAEGGAKLTKLPGFRLLYGLAAAVLWGAGAGFARAAFFVIVIGALAAAALSLRLEWEALTQPAAGRRRATFRLLLAAAYAFLVVVALGVASLGYFGGEWLRARL